ncbi:Alternative oxidase, mitochondrial [Erysiphe necator]|uniref:Alternative oxidase n=1 Tax=Uncinula necator TaxID=52586 RepID=A0A0B1NZI4_UNCNE|nr:Alternative oxidase, mitochondrial [Erysiphe necator]KHJ30091.1 putative alternative oxidase [Erysiphe necator]
MYTSSSRLLITRVSTTLIFRPVTGAALRKAQAFKPLRVGVNPHDYYRHFSLKSVLRLKDCVPEIENENIKKTEAAWPHPQYGLEQMETKISYAHRKPQDFSDRVALYLVRLLRFCTDFATGYKHDVDPPKAICDGEAVVASKPYKMSERKWLIRFVFLESVAGVPGMVAGMLRHLHSLRRLKRDNGWIETLLEEAYNERMHLLTFLKMSEPGWFMRMMIIGAQGVFFNSMFLSYLISPSTCHRFVGYLEEEAVLTYTLAIQDIEAGKLPNWSNPNFRIPDIAVNYWKIPEGHRNMRNLLMYVRADEAKHREVNHTLGNLNQIEDPNPFVNTYKDPVEPRPSKTIENIRPTGWERHEVI